MNRWKQKLLNDGLIHLELFITRKCNIKCKNCMFYCNINKTEDDNLYPIEHVRRDFEKLKKAGVVIGSVVFMGGEPLMVDNLLEYIKVIREFYTKCNISIFTNAVLLNRLCNEESINILKQYNATICYTRYLKYIPSALKHITFLKDNDVIVDCIGDMEHNTTQDNRIQTMMNKQTLLPIDSNIDIFDNSNIHFQGCEHNLLHMCDGKIYTCGRGYNIKYLNEKYGFKYPEKNYIDIDAVRSNEDLIQFSYKPCKLCAYCANVDSDNPQTVPWSQEPAEITDYIE